MVASITPSPLFLSTPSARRATCRAGSRRIYRPISIHALREEGDGTGCRPVMSRLRFLSTPSARRATCESYVQEFYSPISIHALREEGDLPVGALSRAHSQFLSTPSARRATQAQKKISGLNVFLSTPSARRATAALRLLHPRRPISIHALREEGDSFSWSYWSES